MYNLLLPYSEPFFRLIKKPVIALPSGPSNGGAGAAVPTGAGGAGGDSSGGPGGSSNGGTGQSRTNKPLGSYDRNE